MTVTDWIQAISMLILVAVTGVYAWRTHVVSTEAKKQANASIETAEEMRKERRMTARPIVVVSSMHEPAFEICNDGSVPAVNLEIRLLNKDKNILNEKKVPFLRAHDTMKFSPDISLINQAASNYYLFCGYRSVLSKGAKPPIYKTGLIFEIRRDKDNSILIPIRLLFGDEAETFSKKA